ncbi:MAG: hypothetical protein COB02_16200 [Candidatus Cloacimonadota bacterium]|nr:MAG: hypothetical protein COB02_16200 [Candidatus Cloacimonadota bacterium]
MYIKWIHCKVQSSQKLSFFLAQQQWNKISSCDGFIFQIGGWSIDNNLNAYILCAWKSKNYFDQFMADVHDLITDLNHQEDTYLECNVSFFKCKFLMPGKYNDLQSPIAEGKYLRFADCLIYEDCIEHFIEVQESIWKVEMSQISGMLGGFFLESDNNSCRFLVVTLWDSIESHNLYIKTKVSQLRKDAKVSNDLSNISGCFIELINKWSIYT